MYKKLFLAVSIAYASTALAAFDTVEIRNELPVSNSVRTNAQTGVIATDVYGLTQLGNADEKILAVKGFARDIPLLTALKQIVPTGWHAKKNGELDIYMPVSWKGDGSNWVQILDKLANTYKFNVIIDWQKKELSVGPAGWQAIPSEEVIRAVRTEKEKEAVNVKVNEFNLIPGKTLRENIEAWAKATGYDVIWNAADYPVTRLISFKGDLVSEGGPLYQLVEAFRNAEQPISIAVLAGKVIKVTNANVTNR